MNRPSRLLCFPLAATFIVAAGFACKDPSPPSSKAAPAISSSGIPPIPDSLRSAMSPYLDAHGAMFAGWEPDGSGMLVLARDSETNQLFSVVRPGGARRKLTFFNESVIGTAVCPDSGRRFVIFTKDSGGDENFQLFALYEDSQKIERLTDGAFQNDGVLWSNKGDRFVFTSNRRNGRDFDLFLTEKRTGAPAVPVLARGGNWSALDWSPGDRRILVSHYRSRTASSLFVLDPGSGRVDPLHDTSETASEEVGAWGPEGKGIFYTSDKNTDFRSLRYHDCATKRDTLLTAAIHWDIREITLSRERALLAFTTNADGFSEVYLMDTRTFAFRKIPGLPMGVIMRLAFHPSGNFLALTVNMPQRPDEVHVVDVRAFSLERWTTSEYAGIDALAPAAPEVIHYPTFDSVCGKPRLIPCFIYKPREKSGPFPALVVIHGGPESQYWPYFSPTIQYYVNELGIAVLAPNVRGSGGYGKAYLSLDDGYKREDAVRDIGALLDWIARQPAFDASRVACSGGSYGGYLSLAAMVWYNDRLRAGIDCYGIGNFITFLERTAAYRRDLRRVEYGDERDPGMRAFLKRISPLTGAAGISKPLLIVQGANDPRVPLEESLQIARAVRKNGGDVWLLVAGDEGHGYRKKTNRDHQDFVTAFFLKKFLIP